MNKECQFSSFLSKLESRKNSKFEYLNLGEFFIKYYLVELKFSSPKIVKNYMSLYSQFYDLNNTKIRFNHVHFLFLL